MEMLLFIVFCCFVRLLSFEKSFFSLVGLGVVVVEF